jgi:hypothetical protein
MRAASASSPRQTHFVPFFVFVVSFVFPGHLRHVRDAVNLHAQALTG